MDHRSISLKTIDKCHCTCRMNALPSILQAMQDEIMNAERGAHSRQRSHLLHRGTRLHGHVLYALSMRVI